MNWKSHAAIAFACAAGASYLLLGVSDVPMLLYLGGAGLLAGLLPDIDKEGTRGRGLLDVAVVAGVAIFSYSSSCGGRLCIPGSGQLAGIALLALALLGAYFIFLKFLMPRHRGFTHSIVACLLLGVLLYLLSGKFLALAGLVGYLSHLVADREIKLV
jgi:membrane-bound metal-dependent hydrolase YbcI (DUF457 family)